MTFKEKIQQDIVSAMKAKEELRLSVLRMLISAVKNRELEKRSKTGKEETLTDEEVVATIRSEVKKRKDAAGEFTKGSRADLAKKELAELKILEVYLPAEMSDGALGEIVKEVISSFDVPTARDFGKIMGEAMKRVKGQASGDRVSAFVKKFLAS